MTAASVVRLALPLRGFAGGGHDRCSPGVPVVVSSVTDATLCMKCARRSLESPATSFAQKKRLVSDLKIVASSTAACTRLWTDGTMWASIPMVLHGVVIRSKAPIDAPFAEDILDLIEAILVCCPCEPQLLKTLEGLLEQPIGCFESVPLTSFIECLALRGLIFMFRLLGGSAVALPISTERRLQQIVSACIDWRLPVETQAASCTLLKGILSVQSASQGQRPVASLATDSNFIEAFGRVSHSATRQLILECVVSLIDIAGSLPDQVVIEYCKALEITLLSVDIAQTEYSVVALANIVAMSPQACIISTNACEYLIQCLTRALSLSSHACGAILGSIVLFSNLPHFSANATAAITALAEQLRNWVLCDAFGLAERCIQALSEVVCNCDSRIMTSVRGDDVFDSIMRCTDAAVSATALLPSTREWLLKMLAHILDDYCPSRSAQDSINSILFTVWNALIAEDEANVADILSLCCKLLQNMVAMWHADGSLRFVLSFCEEQLVPLMALRPSWATLEFYDSAFAFLVSTMNRVPLETAQLLDNLEIAGIFDIVNELVEFETVQTGVQEFVIWSLCSSPPFKDDDTAPDSWKSRFPTLASLGISRICGVLPTCSSLPDVVPYCTMLVHRMRSLTAMPASTLQTAIAAISSILARIDRLFQREQPVTSYDAALNVAVRCVLGVAHLQRVAGDDIVFATSSSGGLVLHSLVHRSISYQGGPVLRGAVDV
ncbi:hypothetical protein PBRA_003787 [Plasmodiophora brassicae]|uniref:Uncharacterized protein n=1 Tax=Plasmodiophora brassicae TaxID=37360 RepID=A0A0G4IIH8_PLABS|nr:hypothetical protein PBRA_003787 [Plasmodiophora brassicae]